MRLVAIFVLLLFLDAVLTASKAQAFTCDWMERTGRCDAASPVWEGEESIHFSSNSPCSGITFEILKRDGSVFSDFVTTGNQLETSQPYTRLPQEKGVNLPIRATQCVKFKAVDETNSDNGPRERQTTRAAKSADTEPSESPRQPEATSQRAVTKTGPQPTTKTKNALTAKELEALRREGEAKILEDRKRKARQQQEADEENRQIREMDEQQRKREQAVKKQQPQEQTLYEQERQRQLEQQRQQNRKAWWNAIGAGLGTLGTYYAAPKNPQPLPRPPTYRALKAQRPAVPGKAHGSISHNPY